MFLKLVKGLTVNVSMFRGEESQCACMDEAVIVLLLTFFEQRILASTLCFK